MVDRSSDRKNTDSLSETQFESRQRNRSLFAKYNDARPQLVGALRVRAIREYDGAMCVRHITARALSICRKELRFGGGAMLLQVFFVPRSAKMNEFKTRPTPNQQVRHVTGVCLNKNERAGNESHLFPFVVAKMDLVIAAVAEASTAVFARSE